MVEYALDYTSIFQALADDTRRDILGRVIARESTISELASKYSMSFSAIAKHLSVLEAAKLVLKKKQGRTQIISANPQTITEASQYLKQYEQMWNDRFDKLECILKEGTI